MNKPRPDDYGLTFEDVEHLSELEGSLRTSIERISFLALFFLGATFLILYVTVDSIKPIAVILIVVVVGSFWMRRVSY